MSHSLAYLDIIKFIFFDFDGVFTDNKVYIDESGREMVCCSRSDGLGIELLRKANMDMLILSSETNPVVALRAAKLKIPVVQSCKDKALFLKNYLQRAELSADEVAYVGNDVNDIEAMRLVGFRICPADAHSSVLVCANIVLNNKGGNGAVRELCDMLLAHKKYRRKI